jgi:hypothetical protein
MPTKEDNIDVLPESTGDELRQALGPAQLWGDIMASVKAATKLKRLAGAKSVVVGF